MNPVGPSAALVVPIVPMARQRPSGQRQFNRTDRVSELVREIVASELERIGDERLELVTITAVKVDAALEHADVYWSSISAEEDGRTDEVEAALDELRWKLQQVVNREVRARRTPQIRFRPDDVLASALRIDRILREIDEERQGTSSTDEDDEVLEAGDEDTR